MKKLAIALGLGLVLALFWAALPRKNDIHWQQDWHQATLPLSALADSLAQHESQFALRPNNQARILFAGDSAQKQALVLLYLHGFSASAGEGDPIHREWAERYGANLLLARVAGHGKSSASLAEFSVESAWQSAVEALALAQVLGHKVIIMSTSTGSTLALKLAAEYPDKVQGLINLSPNIAVKDPAARLLNRKIGPWLAQKVIGEQRRIIPSHPDYPLYWDTLYPSLALCELQALLEASMTEETFASVLQPTLNLAYYKNESEQDQVVSVEKIRWMHQALGSSEKELQLLAEVGDHVLASPIKSKDLPAVREAIFNFSDRYWSAYAAPQLVPQDAH